MKVKRTAILLCLTYLLLAGCGGGGGGGATAVNELVFAADWSNSTTGTVTGKSLLLRLFDSGSRTVRSLIVVKNVPGVQEITFAGIDAGEYRLVAQLFASEQQIDLTGTADIPITVSGSTRVEVGVGDTPVSLNVSPASAAFKVQSTQQFNATLKSALNRVTFAEPNSIVWSQLVNVCSIDPSTGLAMGSAAGSGSVRASSAKTGLSGASTVNVTPFVTARSKWTVLVYMNAANDLAQFSGLNVNQMEQVAQNPDVRFVVQWKQALFFDPKFPFEGTRRYLVRPDLTDGIASELIQNMGSNIDMGSPTTLQEFIQWGRTFFPADRYVLVIWNHGNGWKRGPGESYPTRGVSYDDQFGTSINTWQLAQALGPDKWDIVAWDASLMQMFEVADEIKDRTGLVVGSEESPPGEGYPYERIFGLFRDTPDAPTKELAKAFVNGMLAVPEYASRKITQSVLETSKFDGLTTALDQLGSALLANKDTIAPTIGQVRAAAQTYSQNSTRYYRDLYDLCDKLKAAYSISQITNAANLVQTAINNLIVFEGHNANSSRSHGVSIDFSPGSVFAGLSADYANLRVAQATHWDEWLAVAAN